MSNPTIGFYLSPFPKQFHKNNENKYVFMFGSFIDHEIKIIKEKNYNYYIIPYNINKNQIDKCINMLDGLIICGNLPGPYIDDTEHKKHYKTINIIFNKIIKINKIRPFPIIGECYGYEMLINSIEKKNVYDKNLFTNMNVKEPMFYKKTIFLNKKYKNIKSYFYLNIGFLYNNLKKTSILKNNYEIISLLKINKHLMIDIMKHVLYPIYLTKSHAIYDNKYLKNEFFYYSKLSYEYRTLNNKNIKKNNFPIKILKYKTINNPHKQSFKYENKIRLYRIN